MPDANPNVSKSSNITFYRGTLLLFKIFKILPDKICSALNGKCEMLKKTFLNKQCVKLLEKPN